MLRQPVAFLAAAILALALAAGPARAGDLASVVYERTLMREAGARCKLFEPKLQAGLAAGALQARGAALRAGVATEALAATESRAQAKAATVPCASPDLAIAAQRVRAAFLGWSRQTSLALPGVRTAWTVRRSPAHPGPFWALAEPLRIEGRPAMLGLRRVATGAPDQFAVETAAPAAGAAYVARLVMRDPALAPGPYLAADGQPPGGATLAVVASGRTVLDGGTAWRFSFPMAAVDALARLDPRENARLEFVVSGPGGERTVQTLVEVGDFAVGRAFLAAAR